MYWTKTTTAIAAYGAAAIVSAHGGGSEHLIPGLAGAPPEVVEFLMSRNGIINQMRDIEAQSQHVEKRITISPERCGEGVGKCQPGACCSSAGYCGFSNDHCWAPDCQINFGEGCDGNSKPKGQDTSNVKREKLGKVLYGAEIYQCVNKGEIAITYDDGPFYYTGDLLDIFKKYGGKATFFINGNNKGKGHINDPEKQWGAIIKRMADEGHQIASHSWSHQNYTTLTKDQFRDQVIWNEIAINDILGYFPTYYRPPYSICPEECQKTLGDLGYHDILFMLDTNGLANDSPSKIQLSKDIWDQAINGSNACEESFIHIEHDLQVQTVYNLTAHMLDSLYQNGYRSVTVGECLGDPAENWYRSGPAGKQIPKYNFPIKENVCNAQTPPKMTFTYTPTLPTFSIPTPTRTPPPSAEMQDASDDESGSAQMVSSKSSSLLALALGVVAAMVV